MTDSMGPGKLVHHRQNPSYAYDEYLICIGLGPNISSVICKNLSYSGPSYPSSPVILLQKIMIITKNNVVQPHPQEIVKISQNNFVIFDFSRVQLSLNM